MTMGGARLSDPDITRAQRLLSIDENQSFRQDVAGWQNESDPAPYGSECNDLVLPSFLCRQETPEYWPEYKHGAVQSIGPQTRAYNSIGMGDHTPENFPQYKPSFGTEHEFCIKLSMANIEGRPLSVTLARVGDPDTPIIGGGRTERPLLESEVVNDGRMSAQIAIFGQDGHALHGSYR